jgi:hypothetical protein
MFNKLVCNILGHKAGGESSCPFTLYTYISCSRCTDIYYAYPTNKKENENEKLSTGSD